ncbi:XdhC family protein, partial [Gorillibacterium massiliense]|uniref:XdhC family protein n=1 Tax=Gorillibacterium massiliense TaxID=1280390 RepID=UPI0006935A1E
MVPWRKLLDSCFEASHSLHPKHVLATVISVNGHAYGKPGTAMLISENGASLGSISPGCMEQDLAARVPEMLKNRQAQIAVYDLASEDDPMWGAASGCGGSLTVLLEPVEGELMQTLLQIREQLAADESVVLKRTGTIQGKTVQLNYQLETVRERCGNEEAGAILVAGFPAEFPEAAKSGQEASQFRFDSLFAPDPQLLLFGAGNDAMPVAALAAQCGYRVAVADWRAGLCTTERFPAAERLLLCGWAVEELAELRLGNADCAVVMSHQLERDRAALEQLAKQPMRSVGIMGSAVRISRLLAGFTVPAWFRYPVGLAIGARGQEEIAVSIAAELIALRRMGPVGRR